MKTMDECKKLYTATIEQNLHGYAFQSTLFTIAYSEQQAQEKMEQGLLQVGIKAQFVKKATTLAIANWNDPLSSQLVLTSEGH